MYLPRMRKAILSLPALLPHLCLSVSIRLLLTYTHIHTQKTEGRENSSEKPNELQDFVTIEE